MLDIFSPNLARNCMKSSYKFLVYKRLFLGDRYGTKYPAAFQFRRVVFENHKYLAGLSNSNKYTSNLKKVGLIILWARCATFFRMHHQLTYYAKLF